VNGLDKLDFDFDFERLVFFRFGLKLEDVVDPVFLAGGVISMTTLREVLEVR